MKEDNNNNDLDHDIDLSIILQIKSEQSFFLTTWKFTGETLTDRNGIQTHKNLVCKRTVSPVWLNSWVFVYKLSGSKFESCYCHLTSLTFRQEIGLINFDVFSEREKLLLTLRTQIKEISNVCYHHKQIYLIKHAMSQRKWADPFKLHKKPHKGMTKPIQTFISYFSNVVIFTVEIKLWRIALSILLNYFAKLLFRKKKFSACHRKTCLYP